MKIRDFFQKDLITSSTGRNLGKIYDLDIGFDSQKGNIEVLIFFSKKGFFRKHETKTTWEKVKIIGEDVIILNL